MADVIKIDISASYRQSQILNVNRTTLADPRGGGTGSTFPPITKSKMVIEDKDNITEVFQCIFPYLKQRYFNVSGYFLIGLHK